MKKNVILHSINGLLDSDLEMEKLEKRLEMLVLNSALIGCIAVCDDVLGGCDNDHTPPCDKACDGACDDTGCGGYKPCGSDD